MILVIDDDNAVLTSISLLLKQSGFLHVCASNPKEAQLVIQEQKPDLVVLDLNFSNSTTGNEGMQFLLQLKQLIPKVPVILITAWGSISLAVEGMKNGAFDFITKPWDNKTLLQTISIAIELNKEYKSEKGIKRQELDQKFNFTNIVGNSPKIIPILETVGRVSKTDAPVLILGESGTGKELIAEALHNNSNRKNYPFVKVNLGGVSSNLFESEMFGHKKGAFTDAYNDRKGRFELANNGTIFLDEIGDLDFNSQVKLLRVLQDKTYQVLGDSKTRELDVRVICATNRNIHEMVEKGTFREDLFYRINLITINLPSLRERSSDIPQLASHFLNELATIYNVDKITLSNQTLKWLKNLPFLGNVREIKNLIERTWLISGKAELEITDFEKALENKLVQPSNEFLPPVGAMTLDEIEKEMILKAIVKYKNNISKIAKSLGISRGTLYRRLEKHEIEYEIKK
ncbi:MAG: sigma-54 dependent transcriptional regulator [Bacteroidales bacterium]|nr:sigma-54 dependent transcriptional regulator [Bacteroidales bacterium]